MKVGFVKSIAALLLGTGLAAAQGPARMPLRSARTDASYPATSMQQGYGGPVSSETPPPENFGGVDWGSPAENPYRVYVGGEFLLWNIRNPNLPPLATSIPVGLVLVTQTDTFVGPGAGMNNTVQSVFSVPFAVQSNPTFPNGQSIDMGEHNGVRVTAGVWFDADRDLGLELGAFWLEKLTEQFRNTTANTVNQFNLQTGVADRTFFVPLGQAAQLTSQEITVFPAQSTSEVNASYSTELWGGEANLRTSGYEYGMVTFGALAGVRYLNFEDTFQLTNNVNVTDAPQSNVRAPFLPIRFSTFDRVRAQNVIIAPQVGVEAEALCAGFFVNARGKVAIGPNFQEVRAEGFTTVVGSANPLTRSPGGLLSGPSNQGDFDRTRVSVVPEINLKVGYQFGPAMRVSLGYDALYMQHVVRSSQQTSFTSLTTTVRVADSTNTVNIQQPVITVRDLDVWVQGISLGMEFRY